MTLKHYGCVLVILFGLHYVVSAFADVIEDNKIHFSVDPGIVDSVERALRSQRVNDELGQLVRVSQFFFDFGEFKHGRPHGYSLAGMKEKLAKNPNAILMLVGYADLWGDEVANYHLSDDRAQWLKGSLIANGISSSRIYTLAMGEAKPPFYDDNEGLNRRVDVYLTAGSN